MYLFFLQGSQSLDLKRQLIWGFPTLSQSLVGETLCISNIWHHLLDVYLSTPLNLRLKVWFTH